MGPMRSLRLSLVLLGTFFLGLSEVLSQPIPSQGLVACQVDLKVLRTAFAMLQDQTGERPQRGQIRELEIRQLVEEGYLAQRPGHSSSSRNLEAPTPYVRAPRGLVLCLIHGDPSQPGISAEEAIRNAGIRDPEILAQAQNGSFLGAKGTATPFPPGADLTPVKLLGIFLGLFALRKLFLARDEARKVAAKTAKAG